MHRFGVWVLPFAFSSISKKTNDFVLVTTAAIPLANFSSLTSTGHLNKGKHVGRWFWGCTKGQYCMGLKDDARGKTVV